MLTNEGVVKNGLFGCDKSGGFYELQEGESPKDFEKCDGNLRYVKHLKDEKPLNITTITENFN